MKLYKRLVYKILNSCCGVAAGGRGETGVFCAGGATLFRLIPANNYGRPTAGGLAETKKVA